MKPEIEKLEESIKKVHRVGFTPKYKETFHTKLSKPAFLALAIKAIGEIGWDLIYYDDQTVEAKRKNDWDRYTESIAMTYEYGTVTVQSTSLGNEMWDLGRNSKRVKLFQLVLNDLERTLSDEEVREFEEEQKKVDEWEDYKIPESLPAPIKHNGPNIYIPLAASIVIAILLGYILAFTISAGFYIIGLFDVGIGFGIGYILAQTLKLGNYTDFNRLRLILITSVIVSFISCQVFIYKMFLSENPFFQEDFITFMQMRLEAGMRIKNVDTGWIGLVISWGFLLFFGYYIGLMMLVSGILKHQLNRVPPEVVDYAVYLFVKDHNEDQVRRELSKLGWSDPDDQDHVFEAIGAVQEAKQIERTN